jgi:predicted methyltransferase
MLQRLLPTLAAIVLLGGFPSGLHAQAVSPELEAAVADPGRPERDRLRDALRKPAETLAFAGVRPGMRAMDLMPGGGYFTRILSAAVGEQGRVYAFQPHEVVSRFSDYRRAMDALDAEPHYENVAFMFDPIETFTVAEPLDLVFTALNYHDIHAEFMGPAEAAAVNRAIFAALRPGGLYVVVDHHATAGSGLADVNRIHRIDAELVKQEVLAAGFILDAQSDLLAHPEDARTRHVYEADMRGRTDQFAFRFRKPD